MMGKNRNKRRVNATGRNEHTKFVKLPEYLLASAAYRLLSPGARALLVEFVRLFNGSNNGRLFMSQRDAQKVLGVRTHQTAGKYIRELCRRGFLRIVVPGSFDNKAQLASVFELTEHPVGSTPAAKDFMRLKLSEQEKARVEEMLPSWRKNRTAGLNSLPAGYLDSINNPTRILEFPPPIGDKDCTTYNIPGQGVSDGATSADRRAA